MKIVGRRKTEVNQNNSNGDSRGNGYSFEYKLDDGSVVSNEQAYEMALNGQIEGVLASHNGGTKYIISDQSLMVKMETT